MNKIQKISKSIVSNILINAEVTKIVDNFQLIKSIKNSSCLNSNLPDTKAITEKYDIGLSKK